jgi:uncharacterized protein YdeI (YjbR/CyaY-like superfamily)
MQVFGASTRTPGTRPTLNSPKAPAVPLDEVPESRTHWDAFPPSARKQMLWWVGSAVKLDTRARRIVAIVARAEQGARVGEGFISRGGRASARVSLAQATG